MSNILPDSQKKAVAKLRLLRIVTTTLWALTFLIGAAGVLLVPFIFMVNGRFALANQSLRTLESNGVAISSLDVAALEARTQALSKKLATELPMAPTEYIARVRSLAGTGIALSGFDMEAGDAPSLKVSGVASSREVLQRFVDTLQHDEGVVSVESPVSNYVKSTSSPFDITVTFK